VDFQNDNDELNFKKSVMTTFSVMSSLLRHQKRHQTTSQDFSILGPSQSKFLATPVDIKCNK